MKKKFVFNTQANTTKQKTKTKNRRVNKKRNQITKENKHDS